MTLLVLRLVILLANYTEAQAGCNRGVMPTSSPECDEMSGSKFDIDKDNNVSTNSVNANTSIVEHVNVPTHSNYIENTRNDSQLHPFIPSTVLTVCYQLSASFSTSSSLHSTGPTLLLSPLSSTSVTR